jgi:hypothetical protein
MKINEIIIREDPPIRQTKKQEPVTTTPQKPDEKPDPKPVERPKSSGSWQSILAPGELAQMQTMFRDNPELVRFVQYALQLPHITNMPQALAYANAELAAQRAKDAKLATTGTPSKPRPGQGMSGMGRIDRKERSRIGVQAFDRSGEIPGLKAVKKAGAKIINDIGDWVQDKAGVDKDDQELVTRSISNRKAKGDTIAKDFRS